MTGASFNGTQTESYTYDNNGNRTGTGYTTGTQNELSASPGETYTYDNAGNLISQTNTSSHVTTTYTYDYHNRLTSVEVGGTVVATYTYNALDQRIGIDDNSSRTWTVYNGSSPDAQPYADFTGGASGGLAVRYVTGPGMVNGSVVDQILARTSASGATAWYLTDKLGSVRDIVSSSGTVLDHIVYDSFGNIVSESNASNGDRFKFAGMEYDSTTGQNFDRARDYSAVAGRFITQDPMSFTARSMDLYAYVGNAPINDVDPSGREPKAYNPPQNSDQRQNMINGLQYEIRQLRGQQKVSQHDHDVMNAMIALETNLTNISSETSQLHRWSYEVGRLQSLYDWYNGLRIAVGTFVAFSALGLGISATFGLPIQVKIIFLVMVFVGSLVFAWSNAAANSVGSELNTAKSELISAKNEVRRLQANTQKLCDNLNYELTHWPSP